MVPQNSLVTNFLQNIFLCVQQNKDIQIGWNYLRVSKWWQNLKFWVNYPFKVSYGDAKNNIILCIWCNAMYLRDLRIKKHIFHIPYIIVAPFYTAFLKRVDFYKAQHSEKRGVLWLASYPVHCDWPKTSGVWQMICPLPHLETHNVSRIWRRQQQYYSENKSYAFFLCVNIWPVLCKSSNTLM